MSGRIFCWAVQGVKHGFANCNLFSLRNGAMRQLNDASWRSGAYAAAERFLSSEGAATARFASMA